MPFRVYLPSTQDLRFVGIVLQRYLVKMEMWIVLSVLSRIFVVIVDVRQQVEPTK